MMHQLFLLGLIIQVIQVHSIKFYDKGIPELDMKGEFGIDVEQDKDIVKTRGGENDGVIVVTDRAKNVIGWFDPKREECLLLGGIDDRYPPVEKIVAFLENDEPIDLSFMKAKARLVSNRPVKDLSVIPSELRLPCSELPTYWVKLVPEQDGQNIIDKLRAVPRSMKSTKTVAKRCWMWCSYG